MDEAVWKTINAYDATAEDYYNETKELSLQRKSIRAEFLRLLKRNGRILDLGCGPGRDSKIFSDLGYNVVGIDLSPRMISKAKLVAPNAEFKIMGFMTLDFPDEYFDGIWFEEGLPCIRKGYAPTLLKKICIILKKGGIFYVSAEKGNSEGMQYDEKSNKEKYWAYYLEDELQKMLSASKFDVIKMQKIPFAVTGREHELLCFICKRKYFEF